MDLHTLTIQEALRGIEEKKYSAEEIRIACLSRINKYNPDLNAFITVNESSGKADFSGKKFMGIPVAFKDIYSTKGVRTTAGSRVLEDYIPPYNATVVEKITSAGGVLTGKTNLDAWAHGSSGENSDYGHSKNPWNQGFVPGGSSSGSAVALSAGMCLASFGTDTGGSVRLPASFCNLVGLKPTYGRVSRYGVIAMASSHDTMGHFTRTVYDSALLLSVSAGFDTHDATSAKRETDDYIKNIGNGVQNMKIGIPEEFFGDGLDARISALIKKTIKKYEELGAEIVGVNLPHSQDALAVYYILQPSEVSSNLGRYDGIRYGNGRQAFSPEAKRRIMLGTYTLSAGYYDAYYLKAMKVRTLIIRDYENAFKKADVLLGPVSPTLPFRLGEKTDDPLSMYLSDIYTVTINLAGIPSISVPCGFLEGLPVGFQLVGPQFAEELLFRAGYAYQQVTDWHTKYPQL